MKFLLVLPLVIIAASLLLLRRSNLRARPDLPPLTIRPDDPLMKEAVARAKESISRFRELAGKPHRSRRIKVPVITSKGWKEYLWADVLALNGSEAKVRYVMPPTSEEGPFKRIASCSLYELVDWQVESPTGQYTGGFTVRVMLIRAREQWGTLPPQLEAEEKKYEADTSWNPASYMNAISQITPQP